MLILASASPRRAALLEAAGFSFRVQPADVDETPLPGETGEALVARLSRRKAAAVRDIAPDDIVLAADTTVVCDHQILNKPEDDEDAARMVRLLSGRAHEVYTGVTLRQRSREETFVAKTVVWFRPLTDAEIAWYVASGEPRGKAGAYGIQGLASRFVTRVDGDYPSVVGLPVAQVAARLALFTPQAS